MNRGQRIASQGFHLGLNAQEELTEKMAFE